MNDDEKLLRREFAEYFVLANLRIDYRSGGHEAAYRAYVRERETPTPLMLQAREAVLAGVQTASSDQTGTRKEGGE